MKQLTGLDATFLYMETPSTYGHVSGLSIYDRPSPDFEPLAAWRSQIERRIDRLEPLTRHAPGLDPHRRGVRALDEPGVEVPALLPAAREPGRTNGGRRRG